MTRSALDLEGRVIAWNRAMEEMTGVSADSVMGRGNFEYSLPFYGARRPILIDLIYASDEDIRSKYHFVNKKGDVLLAEADVAFGGKGGRNLWGKASPLYDSGGKIVGAIEAIRDITDQKTAEKERMRLEEHLRRAEKMEALGTLAGGVAHDLNNVLGVITGYTELILHGQREEGPTRTRLKQIFKSAGKAAAIVEDLLTLARRGVFNREIFNLNDLLGEFLQSPELMKLSSHHPFVRVHADLSPALVYISGSFVHFEKTLFNLVCNAAESMPEGGELRITTRNEYLDSPVEGYERIVPGEYAVITVGDTGEGIPEKDMPHIFEPFYTRKVMGKSGTGLGLAVVWGTVEDHGGYIRIESREGSGTMFTLYLPGTVEQPGNSRQSPDITVYMGRGERVLVVDDVAEQRDLASEMLTGLDYRVAVVESGEAGVEYLKKNHVDLVILDMIMDPGMDGLETYERMIRVRRHQRAIIVSGFAETERGAGAYIRKPYSLEELGMAVRKELDRPG